MSHHPSLVQSPLRQCLRRGVVLEAQLRKDNHVFTDLIKIIMTGWGGGCTTEYKNRVQCGEERGRCLES